MFSQTVFQALIKSPTNILKTLLLVQCHSSHSTVLRIYPQFPLFWARCQLESHDVLNVCVFVWGVSVSVMTSASVLYWVSWSLLVYPELEHLNKQKDSIVRVTSLTLKYNNSTDTQIHNYQHDMFPACRLEYHLLWPSNFLDETINL